MKQKNIYQEIKERNFKIENMIRDYLAEFKRLEVFTAAQLEGYEERLMAYVEAAARVQAMAVCGSTLLVAHIMILVIMAGIPAQRRMLSR